MISRTQCGGKQGEIYKSHTLLLATCYHLHCTCSSFKGYFTGARSSVDKADITNHHSVLSTLLHDETNIWENGVQYMMHLLPVLT